jgi:hypothetical protein
MDVDQGWKSMLNELSMKIKGRAPPRYTSVKEGADHAPVWVTTVCWDGRLAQGAEASKQQSEEAAARAMLVLLSATHPEYFAATVPVKGAQVPVPPEVIRPPMGIQPAKKVDSSFSPFRSDATALPCDLPGNQYRILRFNGSHHLRSSLRADRSMQVNFAFADTTLDTSNPLGGNSYGKMKQLLNTADWVGSQVPSWDNPPTDPVLGQMRAIGFHFALSQLTSNRGAIIVVAFQTINPTPAPFAAELFPENPGPNGVFAPLNSGAGSHPDTQFFTQIWGGAPPNPHLPKSNAGAVLCVLTQSCPAQTVYILAQPGVPGDLSVWAGRWNNIDQELWMQALDVDVRAVLLEDVNIAEVAGEAAQNPLLVEIDPAIGVRVQGVIEPDTPVWTSPAKQDKPNSAGAPGVEGTVPAAATYAPLRRMPAPQRQPEPGLADNTRAAEMRARGWNQAQHALRGNQERWGQEVSNWARQYNCLILYPSAQTIAPALFDDNPFKCLASYEPDDVVVAEMPEEDELLADVQEDIVDHELRSEAVKTGVAPASGPKAFVERTRRSTQGEVEKLVRPKKEAAVASGLAGPAKKKARKFKNAQEARDDYNAMVERIAKRLAGDTLRLLTWVYEHRSSKQIDGVMRKVYGPTWAESEDAVCRHVSAKLWFESPKMKRDLFLFMHAISDSQYMSEIDEFPELFERMFGMSFPTAVKVYESEARAHGLRMHSEHGNILGLRLVRVRPAGVKFLMLNIGAEEQRAAGWARKMHSGNGNTSWPQSMADVQGSKAIWDVAASHSTEVDYDPQLFALQRGTGAFMNNLFTQDESETVAFRARWQDGNGVTQPDTRFVPNNETCFYALQVWGEDMLPGPGARPSGYSCSAHNFKGEPVRPTKLWSELKNAVQSNQNNQQKRDATMVSGFLGNDVVQEGATIGVEGWDATPLILRLSLLNEALIWNQPANFLPVSGGLTGCNPDIYWEPTNPPQGQMSFGEDLPNVFGVQSFVAGPAPGPLQPTPVFPFNSGAPGVFVQVAPPPAAPVPGPNGTGALAFHQSVASVPPNAPRIYVPTWVYECGGSRERMLALWISLFVPWPWAMAAQLWSANSVLNGGAPTPMWYGHHATMLLLPGSTELHVILPRATVSPNAQGIPEAQAASAIIPTWGPQPNSGIPAGEQIDIMGGQQNPTQTTYVALCGYICSWRREFTTGDISALLQAMTTYFAVKSVLKWCNQLIAHKVFRTAPMIETQGGPVPPQAIGPQDQAFNINLDSTANQATPVPVDLPVQAQFVADVRIPPLNLTALNKIVLGLGTVTQALGDDGLAVGKYINNVRVVQWNMITHRMIGLAWTAVAGSLGIGALYYNDAYGTSPVSGVVGLVRSKWPNKGPGYRPASALLMAWVERLFMLMTGGKLRENMYSQSVLHSDVFVEGFTVTTTIYAPGGPLTPIVTACPVLYPDVMLQTEAHELPKAVQGFPVNNTPVSTSGIPVPAGRGGITAIGGGTLLAPPLLKESQEIQVTPQVVPRLTDDEIWNKRLFMRIFATNFTMTDMSATPTPVYGPPAGAYWRMMDYPPSTAWPTIAPIELLQTTLGLMNFETTALRIYPTMPRLNVQAINQVLNGNNRTTLTMFAGSRGTLVDVNVLGNDFGGVGGFFGDMLKAEDAKLNSAEPGPTTTVATSVPDVPIPKVVPDASSGAVMSITGTGLTSEPQ